MEFRTEFFNTKLLHYNANVSNIYWRNDNLFELSSEIKEGSRVYLRPVHVKFLAEMLDSIDCHFVLITGDGDGVLFEDIFPSFSEFERFIQSEKVIHWYAQDLSLSHPKISPIPVGLDYHTLTERQHYWGPMKSPLDQEKDLLSVRDQSEPFWNRKIKCYSNFHFNFHVDRHGNDRQQAVDQIPPDCIFYEPEEVSRLESWKRQSEYAFVVSPHGNGLDCHRTWEALILGCIVVVKESSLDPLYTDLPVLILKSWSDLNNDLLKQTVENFQVRNFNYYKLTSKYYLDMVGLVY